MVYYDVATMRKCLKGRAVVYLKPLQEDPKLHSLKPEEVRNVKPV